MSTKQRLSVSTGQDILSYIPHALGYWPVRSLVCITMTGKAVGATLRVDLPSGEYERNRAYLLTFAERILGYLQADETSDGVLLAIFGSQDWLAIRPVPQGQLMATLQKAFAMAGTPVKDSWYVGPDHWRNYRCTDASCCGWPGRPQSDIAESKLNAELIFMGSSYSPEPPDGILRSSRSEAGGIQGLRLAIGVRQREYTQEFALNPCGPDQLRATMEVWELAMARWPAVPDVATAGFLLASLESLTVRDAVLVSCSVSARLAVQGAAACGLPAPITTDVLLPEGWQPTPAERESLRAGFQAPAGSSQVTCAEVTPGGAMGGTAPKGSIQGTTPGGSIRGTASGGATAQRMMFAGRASTQGAMFDGAEFRNAEFGAAEFGAVLMGATGNSPDWCRMDVAARLLEYLAGAAGGDPQAAALTMLGWVSWCRGRSSAADGYLRQALSARPGYRLAGLLRELVGQGNICGWAKRRSTAWRGPDPDASEGAL